MMGVWRGVEGFGLMERRGGSGGMDWVRRDRH